LVYNCQRPWKLNVKTYNISKCSSWKKMIPIWQSFGCVSEGICVFNSKSTIALKNTKACSKTCIKFHTWWFGVVRIVCDCKTLVLQILSCLSIYDHRPSFWSWIHSMFDEEGNKIFKNEWCIGKRIENIKSFWRIVSIALILILIDWHRWRIDKGPGMREVTLGAISVEFTYYASDWLYIGWNHLTNQGKSVLLVKLYLNLVH